LHQKREGGGGGRGSKLELPSSTGARYRGEEGKVGSTYPFNILTAERKGKEEETCLGQWVKSKKKRGKEYLFFTTTGRGERKRVNSVHAEVRRKKRREEKRSALLLYSA